MDWILVGLTAAILLVLWLLGPRRAHGFPPGPAVWPWLGNVRELIQIIRRGQTVVFDQLAERYGDIVGLVLPGGVNVVIIRDLAMMKAAYSDLALCGRPYNFAFLTRAFMKKQGLVYGEGDLWLEHFRFTLRHLRDLGFGKSSMQEHILDEYRLLAEKFRQLSGKPQQMKKAFDIISINIVWQMITGYRFKLDDPMVLELRQTILDFVQNSTFQTPVNIAPCLRHVFPRWSGYEAIVAHRSKICKMFTDVVEDHKIYLDNSPRDLVDEFLKEMRRPDAQDRGFTEQNLYIIGADLFSAGSDTTTYMLAWITMFLAKYQDIQFRLRREIQEVLGGRPPTFEDQTSLPYCMSVIQETFRWVSLLPHAIPHSNSFGDVKINQYHIPRASVIFADIRAVHMDKTFWRDPEAFRPERFLDSTGKYHAGHHVLAFGVGRRSCPAEKVARLGLFLITTCLVWQFNIRPAETLPEFHQETSTGFVNVPPPCQLVLEWRQGLKE